MKFLLVSGGEVFDYNFFKKTVDTYNPDFTIAIDKGANYLDHIGMEANLLIGDLDSVDIKLKQKYENKILKLKVEKDDTDTAVALDYALNNGAKEVLILQGVGSRFDHTFGNILILKRALDRNIKCTLINEQNEIRMHKESFVLENMTGSTVSFFALDNDVNITLKGFYYPLNNYILNKYDPIAISNKVILELAEVIFDNGNLLSVVSKDK
ncbi:thiamine diphosphokinase [Anaerofustis sp.]|uniref:thiamine diphosphokinase n=1 Tax=Anaerofustis sp. TaxID=1872517 RepID=UPI0025BB37FC|nr:thiamine diphosphokinase [Anaerofustis sp.]